MGAFGAVVALLIGSIAAASAVLFVRAVLDLLGQSRQTFVTRRRVAEGADDVTHGTLPTTPPDSGRIGEILKNSALGQSVVLNVRNAGLQISATMFVQRVLLAAGAVLLAGALFSGNIAPGIVLAVGVSVGARVWLQGAADKRIETMRAQLPDAFTVVGSSLSSGLSLVQALEYAAKETPAPLGPELWRLVNDVSAGRSLGEALERFRETVPLRELKTISTAIEIQHRVGGNMREMLEQATSSVRQSLELRMSLHSQTAQSRLSAKVVGLMPLVLLGIISLLSKDYIQGFFGSPAGIVLFSIGILLDVVGYAIIRKIMEIEV